MARPNATSRALTEQLTLAYVQADYGTRRLKGFLGAQLMGCTERFISECIKGVAAAYDLPTACAVVSALGPQSRLMPTKWLAEHKVVEWPSAPFFHILPGKSLDFVFNFTTCCALVNHLDAERQRLSYMLQLHLCDNAMLWALLNNDDAQYARALRQTDVSIETLAIHGVIANLDSPLLLTKPTPAATSSVSVSALASAAKVHAPATHGLHGPAFRAAVTAIYMCNTRMCPHLPPEMLNNITARMCRDGWATHANEGGVNLRNLQMAAAPIKPHATTATRAHVATNSNQFLCG